jgi:hypothetical protein
MEGENRTGPTHESGMIFLNADRGRQKEGCPIEAGS